MIGKHTEQEVCIVEINDTGELYQTLLDLRQDAQMFRMMLFGLESCFG